MNFEFHPHSKQRCPLLDEILHINTFHPVIYGGSQNWEIIPITCLGWRGEDEKLQLDIPDNLTASIWLHLENHLKIVQFWDKYFDLEANFDFG